MEDTLRVEGQHPTQVREKSLNPCFNGRYSQRGAWTVYADT